jgi:hypothetical protein
MKASTSIGAVLADGTSHMRLIAILFLMLCVTACDRPDPKIAGSAKPVIQKDNEQPPQKSENALEDEIEAMTPVALVPVAKLLPFLPQALTGFTAGKAEGEAINVDDDKYTIVSRDYRKGGSDFRVVIMDGGRVKAKYRPILRWVGVTDETADDYTKGVNLDGNPGWEHYDRKFKTGNLHLMVGKRYLVTIHLNGVDADVMQAVYKSIDVKGLAAVK